MVIQTRLRPAGPLARCLDLGHGARPRLRNGKRRRICRFPAQRPPLVPACLHLYTDDFGTRKLDCSPGKAPPKYDYFAMGGIVLAEADEAEARRLQAEFFKKWGDRRAAAFGRDAPPEQGVLLVGREGRGGGGTLLR